MAEINQGGGSYTPYPRPVYGIPLYTGPAYSSPSSTTGPVPKPPKSTKKPTPEPKPAPPKPAPPIVYQPPRRGRASQRPAPARVSQRVRPPKDEVLESLRGIPQFASSAVRSGRAKIVAPSMAESKTAYSNVYKSLGQAPSQPKPNKKETGTTTGAPEELSDEELRRRRKSYVAPVSIARGIGTATRPTITYARAPISVYNPSGLSGVTPRGQTRIMP